MARIEQLNNTQHSKIRIKRNTHVSDLSAQNILPVVLGEFPSAAMEFPVCFIKNPQNEEYQTVALMGLEAGENLFVNDGNWDANYMPARYTHTPFGLLRNPEDENQFGIAVDVEHRLVSETEGEPLFTEDGLETEFMQKQKESMANYLDQEHQTKRFVKELEELDLIITRSIDMNIGEKKMKVDGISMVDEEKMKELSDEAFLSLHKKGMLSFIYTHLISMRQMSNLMRRKAKRMQVTS